MLSYLGVLTLLLSLAVLMGSLFWFRVPLLEEIEEIQPRDRVYDQIVIFFFDATGYRQISNSHKDEIYHTIGSIQKKLRDEAENTFFSKTYAVPPSTDFTIMALINGIVQRANYLDVTFKSSPQYSEASLVKRPIKSALFSSKKYDWFKMSSGEFTYVENSHVFSIQSVESADHSAFSYFQTAFNSKKYDLVVCHFMGYDALGHALNFQDPIRGKILMKMYNKALSWIFQRLERNQLFIAVGDHDQSYRGKHYQCSLESTECQGWLFAYGKAGLNQGSRYNYYEPADVSATVNALFGFDTLNQNMGKLVRQFYPAGYNETRIQSDLQMVKSRMLSYLRTQQETLSPNFIPALESMLPEAAMQAAQWQFQFAIPDKNHIFMGALLLVGSLVIVSMPNLKNVAADTSTNSFDVASLSLGYFCSPFFFLAYLFMHNCRQKVSTRILTLAALAAILVAGQFILEFNLEMMWLLLAAAKFKCFSAFFVHLNVRFILLGAVALFSQSAAYAFYFVDRNNFRFRMNTAWVMIYQLLILLCVDPRLFNKQKVKGLYIVILFSLGDLSSVLQLNESMNFIQFTIFFAFMQPRSMEYNLCLAILIQKLFSPILINHSEFPGQVQMNNNALIILDTEFEVAPSLFSIFIGYFGIVIVGLSTLLIEKSSLLPFLYMQAASILINLFQLISYIHDQQSDVGTSIFKLYQTPVMLVQFLLFYAIHLVLKFRSRPV